MMKGLVIKNAHVKYESPKYTSSEVMAKVKVLRTRTNTPTSGYDKSSPDIPPGELNIYVKVQINTVEI